jgi:hypothetical protein
MSTLFDRLGWTRLGGSGDRFEQILSGPRSTEMAYEDIKREGNPKLELVLFNITQLPVS